MSGSLTSLLFGEAGHVETTVMQKVKKPPKNFEMKHGHGIIVLFDIISSYHIRMED